MKWFRQSPPKNIISLDVDGVLLPTQPELPYHDIHSIYGSGALSESCIATVQSLKALAPIYWFTTWMDDANEYFSEWLGMRLPVIPLEFNLELSSQEDKTRSLEQWSEQYAKTQIIVLDDEVRLNTPNIATIPVDARYGLQAHHVHSVQALISSKNV